MDSDEGRKLKQRFKSPGNPSRHRRTASTALPGETALPIVEDGDNQELDCISTIDVISEYSININTDRVYFTVCFASFFIGRDTRVLVPFVTHVGSNRLARGLVLTRT